MKERKRLFARLWDLPYGHVTPYNLFDASKNSRDLVQKLQLQRKIPVHNGCVNSICWNETGNYLLSGSDDQHLSVINASDYSVLAYVRTGHRANIFSARFMPSCGDSHVVSSSGDGIIIYSNLERPETSMNNKFGCHRGTAYEIMTVPHDPNTFLSCGEDKTVRWFDIRTKSYCDAEDCKEDVLIFGRSPITTLAINPLLPYQLAVGSADSSVQIFDRRMLATQATSGCLSNGFRALMTYFTVPDFPQSRRITSLCYSKDGREMLVNYSSDYVYLFDTKDDLGRKPKVFTCVDSDGSVSRTRPVMKRLRVRGDWSDTGPNSRPESDSTVVQNSENIGPNNLVRRMTDILTRMLFSSNQNRTTSNASHSSSESSPHASSHSGDGEVEASTDANTDANDAGAVQNNEINAETSSTSQASDNNETTSQSVPTSDLAQNETISVVTNNPSAFERENVEVPLLIVDTYRTSDGSIPPYFVTSTGIEPKVDGPQTLVTDSGKTYIFEEVDSETSTSHHLPAHQAQEREAWEKGASASCSSKLDEDQEILPSTSDKIKERKLLPSCSSNSEEMLERMPSVSHSNSGEMQEREHALSCSNSDVVQEMQPSTPSTSYEMQEREPSTSFSRSDEAQEKEPSASHSSRSDAARESEPSISHSSRSDEVQEREPSASRSSRSDEAREREILLSEESFYSDAHNLTCTCTKEPPPPPSPTYELETPPEFSPEYEEHMNRSGEVGSESETEAAVQSIQRGDDIPTVSELQSPRSPSPDPATENPEEVELMMEVDSWDSDSEDDGNSQPHSSQSSQRRRRGQASSSCDEMESEQKNEVKNYKPPKNVTRPQVKKIYIGHRNARTMIKESTFWGDNFVMSGSDCGHIFIWDRHTTELVMIMEADHHVVNCLQPHPFDPILASSGIDYDIKIWAPMREEPFFDVEKANEIVKRNKIMLEVTKDTITVPASFMFNMFNTLHNLRNGRRQLYRWNRGARTNQGSSSNR